MRGNYTVEAAILMPIIILLMAMVLNITIGLYYSVNEDVSDYKEVSQIHAAEMFRNQNQVLDLLDRKGK